MWFLATLPIFITAAFSDLPSDAPSVLGAYYDAFYKKLFETDVFVYSASFLAPLLVLFIDHDFSKESEKADKINLSEFFKTPFKGYKLYFIVAAFCLLITAIAYTARSASTPNSDEQNNLFSIMYNSGFEVYIYLFAIFCWYLSLLDGARSDTTDVVEIARQQEDKSVDQFKARIAGRTP